MHEAIAKEVRDDPSILAELQTKALPPRYTDHILVRRARAENKPLPVSIAIYLDGVRCTAPLAGRSDSILGIWSYNLISQKRHLIVSLRTLDLCRSGCGGWCSIYPFMECLKWSLAALFQGKRPASRHDSTPFTVGDSLLELLLSEGEDLGITAAFIWCKGDWSEVSHTLGLPSVNSYHGPRACCGLKQDALHDDYDTMECQPAAFSYDAMCAICEIIITVSTEAERSALLSALHFIKTKTNTSRSGRVLKHAVQVSGVSLEAGDRLEPSAGLWDIMLLDSKRLPLVVTFWRAHYDIATDVPIPSTIAIRSSVRSLARIQRTCSPLIPSTRLILAQS